MKRKEIEVLARSLATSFCIKNEDGSIELYIHKFKDKYDRNQYIWYYDRDRHVYKTIYVPFGYVYKIYPWTDATDVLNQFYGCDMIANKDMQYAIMAY